MLNSFSFISHLTPMRSKNIHATQKVEEHHKIFNWGCQGERYKLAAEGMKTLIEIFRCDCC